MRLALLLFLAPAVALAEAPTVARRLIDAALADHHAFATVASLSDHVGQRLAGSPGAEAGVAWALAAMRSTGLENVHAEPVTFERWVRGAESAAIVAPSQIPLHPTALGGSVGTPHAGTTAEVVEVDSLAALRALGDRVKGKIVFFDHEMARTRDFTGYADAVPLRGHGAAFAARLGAVAAIIRSVGTGAYQLPHTGNTHYDPAVAKIPFAAITTEDAGLIHRLLSSGTPVRIHLLLGCHPGGTARSANVVGELRGTAKPDELVLIGAHLDSWDLGTGAIDDAAGVSIVLETARLFKRFGLPRRTVRVVLFMNEENGLSGAHAYAAEHAGEDPDVVAALEADSGAGAPTGFDIAGGAPSLAMVRELVAPLAPRLPTALRATDEAGADLLPLQAAGVPVLAVAQDMSGYFDWHHTAADTVDKVNPSELAEVVAAFATVTWGLADAPGRLPPPVKPPHW